MALHRVHALEGRACLRGLDGEWAAKPGSRTFIGDAPGRRVSGEATIERCSQDVKDQPKRLFRLQPVDRRPILTLSLLLSPSGPETLVFWVFQPLPWPVAPKDVPLMTRRGDLKLSHGATAKARENAVKQDRVPSTNAIKSP